MNEKTVDSTTSADTAPRQSATEAPTAKARQRENFGGFNFGAAFFGWLVATAVAVLLLALVAAITGGVAISQMTNTDDLLHPASIHTVGVVGGVVLLAVMALAYYAGGYVAGRMSRFDGGRQGFGVWVFGFIVSIVLAIIGAILGAQYDVLRQLNLPTLPLSVGQVTVGSLIALLIILAVTLLAAVGGGKVGERYHRKVDEAVAPTANR